jgi:hypothetical protein
MRIIPAIVFILLVASCGNLKESSEITFEMTSFKLETTPGCKPDSSGCAVYEVEHPRFTGLDSATINAINERIDFWLGGGTPENTQSMRELGASFVTEYNQFLNDMPGYGLGWYFKGKVNVLIASDSLISLQVDTEEFTGAAHASFATNFVNIDPKTGTAFLLGAMLRNGYENELNRLGEEDLRQQMAVDEADSTSLNFGDEGFKLNDNYGFRPEGIVFYFNTYELASYAEGPTEVLIPYELLRDWRK